ncbi:hypothetical protein I4U23_029583 [Adineta vaga]|nr:hypothetical protein I4U23_029583 [Adineta vaga]
MGTCCCGNKPPEKFVGLWTDDQYTELQIDMNGNIQYHRKTEHTNADFTGPTRFSNNSFCFCCCCCSLHGTYSEDDNETPRLITKTTVLRKKINRT